MFTHWFSDCVQRSLANTHSSTSSTSATSSTSSISATSRLTPSQYISPRDVLAAHLDLDDFEFQEDDSLPYGKAMIAGATAGVMEHIFMFPVDTIKTMIQAQPSQQPQKGVVQIVRDVSKSQGIFRLYRGVTAVAISAIPSHAVHFGTYETVKHALGGNKSNDDQHHPIINATAGALATMAHDAVVTPFDVVKQRLQVFDHKYSGIVQCIRKVYHEQGLRAFYASYPTTLAMNVPFMAVFFSAYESFKLILNKSNFDPKHPTTHMIAGGSAGALAGLLTTPLDVIKTRLQIGAETGQTYSGPSHVARTILKEEGWKGLTRGVQARVLYFMPSAAICWSTYEFMKALLQFEIPK